MSEEYDETLLNRIDDALYNAYMLIITALITRSVALKSSGATAKESPKEEKNDSCKRPD